METNEKQVSNNIKAQINKYGYKMGDIADRMGVSRQGLSPIINHPFRTNLKRLIRIADAIGCDIDDFFIPLEFTNSDRRK